ncbi:MAG: response regulator transcription factor [Planctomycetes bacterium]|nr:response regulator transcription factor [Planctomycetota bacterium]
MRVLIVEDEKRLADNICKCLTQAAGYAVDTCGDGRDGLNLARTGSYDLILLDWMLPGLSGADLLRQLRAQRLTTPVLMLTARSARRDIVACLGLGGDDYLTKPFDMAELIARCQALIRRAHGQASSRLEIGPLVVDAQAQRAWWQGEPVHLSAREFRVLAYLAMQGGQIVAKSDLESHLYRFGAEVESNVIEVYISNLRRRLDPSTPHRLIHTLRGQGYL